MKALMSTIICYVFSLLTFSGVFDVTTVVEGRFSNFVHAETATGLEVLAVIAIIYAVIMTLAMIIVSFTYAGNIAIVRNNPKIITAAEERITGLKADYDAAFVQVKELPQEILANGDSPIKTIASELAKAQRNLESAKEKGINAQTGMDEIAEGPFGFIARMYG